MEVLTMKGLVEKAHGKICQDDNNSVSYRKKDGKMFSMRMCNPRDLEKNPYSDKELEIQSTFSELSKIAAAWTAANRVYKSDGRTIDLQKCTDDYKKMRAAFDAQDKIVTFQAYVRAQIKDGAVVVPDVTISSADDDDEETPSTTKYTVTLASSPVAGGTVTGAGSYDEGSTANISAVANSGYTFTRWSDGDTNASRSVTVNSDLDLTAVFTTSDDGDDSNIPLFQ